MSEQLAGINVYVGDIHGARLQYMETALQALAVTPANLLCTMDLDQVLSVQDLLDLQERYTRAGINCLMVPGNHEAAITLDIGIDSSTYRIDQQNTNILALIEAVNLPQFDKIRGFLMDKLALRGGLTLALSPGGKTPALLVHGALAGKQEKYLHEFPPHLQTHVRERTDLWLRLETDEHLKGNFNAMKDRGLEVMIRGHDHYTALRSMTSKGELCAHQLIVNLLEGQSLEYQTEVPRSADNPDDLAFVNSERLGQARTAKTLYWHDLVPGQQHVVNFGPYYKGYFGLLRAGGETNPPSVAFCRTQVTFFNEDDRRARIKPLLSAHQARTGKTFYELFSHRKR